MTSWLKSLEQHLEGRDFLVAGRLTLADISVGYPLHLMAVFGLDALLGPRATAYRERLRTRPAFVRAAAVMIYPSKAWRRSIARARPRRRACASPADWPAQACMRSMSLAFVPASRIAWVRPRCTG